MADGGGGERQFLGSYVQKQTKYGTTTRPEPKHSTYVKHIVSRTDTLMGIALRYGVTVEQVKRENKLWTNDSLFLRESLLVPITKDNSHLVRDDWEIIKCDGPRSRSGSDALESSGGSGSEKPSTSNGLPKSGMDFFSKYDTDIAQLKDNVDKLEKNARHHPNDYGDPLNLLPRRHSEPPQRRSIENPDSPVLVIRSHTKSHRVQTAIQKSEEAQDNLFQL